MATPTPEGEEPAEAVIDLPKDRETGLRVGRLVFFGPTGSGKTLAGCAAARMMAPQGFEDVYVLSPVPTAANQLPEANWMQIPPTDKKKVEAFMATMKNRRALLIVDEADSYFGGSGRTFGTDSMFEAVNFGRNSCLSMIVLAHGTNVTPKNLIANSQGVFFFRTTEPNLLEYAEDYMSDDIPDVTHTLRNLPDYVALVYAPMSKDKFVGFAKLNLDTGEIEIWKPETTPTEETPEPESTTSEPSTPSEDGGSSATPATSGADSSPTSR